MATNPWTMLLEASNIIGTDCCKCSNAAKVFRRRIDEALANRAELAHAAWRPSEEPNLWGNHSQFSVSEDDAPSMQDCLISVTPAWKASLGWSWHVDYRGSAKTEEEAKATALAVAERLR